MKRIPTDNQNNNKVLFVVRDNDTLDFGIAYLPKDNHLKFFYDCLNCRYIDIITRRIGDRYFDFVIDDEGKLYEKPMTAIMVYDKENFIADCLAGSFLITIHNDDGETLPLTSEDLAYIDKMAEVTKINGVEYLVLRY